jgi:hypothetical protein
MQLVPLPMALEWQVAPLDWAVGLDGSLRIVAGPRTDLFVDPAGGPAALGAPRIVGVVEGDFQLSARVRADLQATFDAGALVLHAADDSWVKLALERSPQGEAMVVSVVTRGLSDDANGQVVTGAGVRAACLARRSALGARAPLRARRTRRPGRRLPGPIAHRRGLHGDLRRRALRRRALGRAARRLLAGARQAVTEKFSPSRR